MSDENPKGSTPRFGASFSGGVFRPSVHSSMMARASMAEEAKKKAQELSDILGGRSRPSSSSGDLKTATAKKLQALDKGKNNTRRHSFSNSSNVMNGNSINSGYQIPRKKNSPPIAMVAYQPKPEPKPLKDSQKRSSSKKRKKSPRKIDKSFFAQKSKKKEQGSSLKMAICLSDDSDDDQPTPVNRVEAQIIKPGQPRGFTQKVPVIRVKKVRLGAKVFKPKNDCISLIYGAHCFKLENVAGFESAIIIHCIQDELVMFGLFDDECPMLVLRTQNLLPLESTHKYYNPDDLSNDELHAYIVLGVSEDSREDLRTFVAGMCSNYQWLQRVYRDMEYAFIFDIATNSVTSVKNMKHIEPSFIFRGDQIGTRRSKRITRNSSGTATFKDPDEVFLVYPKAMRGAITIHTSDLACLSEGEYLNDNIIDFYLRYLTEECIPPGMQPSIHIFNTFFYKKYSGLPRGSSPDQRYAAVKNWASKVNLFEKKFIVMPVNECTHWTVAIMCYPNNIGFDLPSDSAEKPRVIMFDSLQTTKVGHQFKVMRDYLRCEYNSRRGDSFPLDDIEFSAKKIKGVHVKVPQQPNGCDCGVYLLQFVEQFLIEAECNLFKHENFDMTRIDRRDWFETEVVMDKRDHLKSIIRKLNLQERALKVQTVIEPSVFSAPTNNEHQKPQHASPSDFSADNDISTE